MADRSLSSWLQTLEQIHPVSVDLGLTRVEEVARKLQLIPAQIASVVVAGTNGKGSVVYTIDAVARGSGQKTGRYTSPHLLAFNERICVNGQSVDDALIVAAFEAIECAREHITLTYFEFATLAALWVFRELEVDLQILEVGLGGRLDAVNIVDCDLAVITAIDLDHQNWLGDSVEEIAPEKAAVARAGRPVVLAEQSYPDTLFTTLEAIGADVCLSGETWRWTQSSGRLCISNPVSGEMNLTIPDGLRAANVAAGVQAVSLLLGDAFDAGTCDLSLSTLTVPARRQRISYQGREVLIDVAHNPAAMELLVADLQARPAAGNTVAIMGVMADKDIDRMVAQLARVVDGACALAIPGIERAADPELLWRSFDCHGIASAQSEFTAERVWEQVISGTSSGDRIVICGSFHSVAGIMPLLNDAAGSGEDSVRGDS